MSFYVIGVNKENKIQNYIKKQAYYRLIVASNFMNENTIIDTRCILSLKLNEQLMAMVQNMHNS